MTRYPKEWLDAANPLTGGVDRADGEPYYYGPQEILDSLREAGALKDPPKPREFMVCVSCYRVMIPKDGKDIFWRCGFCDDSKRPSKMIHVREVLE